MIFFWLVIAGAIIFVLGLTSPFILPLGDAIYRKRKLYASELAGDFLDGCRISILALPIGAVSMVTGGVGLLVQHFH